jgi:signal transduction histidine kinase
LTFGRWVEPYEVLAKLGQRLEATSGVEGLLDDVVDELSALGLDDVSIEDADGEIVAVCRAPVMAAGATSTLDLAAYGEHVGTLRFCPPTPPLRTRDRRLLDDLAGHLGWVLHDHRLTRDLQRVREQLVLAREEERRRLRRDLHDGLGPALAGHLLRLDVIAREVDPSSAAGTHVAALDHDLRGTVVDVRRLVEGLRPPALDELGLAGAVEQATQRLCSGAGLTVAIDIASLPMLPAATEVAVFRIVTEAVTNVVRHAGATECRVAIGVSGGRLRLVVQDDGHGIHVPPSSSAGNGLHTMRERTEEMRGRLRITSSHGTRVTADLPVARLGDVVPERARAGRA